MLVQDQSQNIASASAGTDGGCYQIRLAIKVYRPSVQPDEAIFCDWFSNAAVGDMILYHTGLLSLDRSSVLGMTTSKERARLNALAHRIWQCTEAGLISVFSKRVDENCFEYFAVRNAPSDKTQKVQIA